MINKTEVEQYETLKTQVLNANARILKLQTRKALLVEQLQEKMKALGVNSPEELKARILQEKALLDTETERMKVYLAATQPILDTLEKT